MNKDLGFSPTVFGFGAGIFFLGYFLFEVLSNLVLDKIGAWFFVAGLLILSAVLTLVLARSQRTSATTATDALPQR
jgi:ACS family tartrate transporter-like MFS transporter